MLDQLEIHCIHHMGDKCRVGGGDLRVVCFLSWLCHGLLASGCKCLLYLGTEQRDRAHTFEGASSVLHADLLCDVRVSLKLMLGPLLVLLLCESHRTQDGCTHPMGGKWGEQQVGNLLWRKSF